jgi:hypothetical protein
VAGLVRVPPRAPINHACSPRSCRPAPTDEVESRVGLVHGADGGEVWVCELANQRACAQTRAGRDAGQQTPAVHTQLPSPGFSAGRREVTAMPGSVKQAARQHSQPSRHLHANSAASRGTLPHPPRAPPTRRRIQKVHGVQRQPTKVLADVPAARRGRALVPSYRGERRGVGSAVPAR